MTDAANSNPAKAGADSETRNSFDGVLVSGRIGKILGDLVGGNKIINNFGNPDFEAKLLSLFQSRDASNDERLALATNLIALKLSTVFVDQMRLLYITTGHRVRKANAHLLAHFIERAKNDTEQFNVYMERYSGQLDGGLLMRVNAVEQRCSRALNRFASVHPLPRDRRSAFKEMAGAATPMREVLQVADARTIASTIAVVNDLAAALHQEHSTPMGFAKADEIAILRFEIQAEALKRLQADSLEQILTIDDDVEGNFSPLYFIIDQWLLDRCQPWI
jgi:hypothetical protein